MRNYIGYIPPLTVNDGKQGFLVSATSELNSEYIAANSCSLAGEWATNGVNRNFYIELKCPEQVRIWKVALRGKNVTTGQQIYHWTINASINGRDFVVLYTAENLTYIGNSLQQFMIDTPHKYNYFRLMCIEAEEGNPGLSYMQLFIYSD